ncbi:magnesium/cobalt transporter CorA [Lacrimispora sp.]|uniref:magnesium/cobalt transporter CorA n=1 Tax=Lacrimispora sp. TaxID=2719234 RepID=UPI0028AB3F52|nr:magnesium/cobalt transporter CorA [Lacrimispora sp.]
MDSKDMTPINKSEDNIDLIDNNSMGADSIFIEIIEYSKKTHKTYHKNIRDLNHLNELKNIPQDCVRWINVDGVEDETALQALGDSFHIHPLIIQSISNPNERAKIEEYRNSLHVIAKMLYYSKSELVMEQLNLILGPNYVITFGETTGDVFDGIRNHIKVADSPVRNCGADYLMYLILDALTESYFDILETLNEQIDILEDQVLEKTEQDHLLEIRRIKKELMKINKYIWPLRDVASLLGREAMELIQPTTEPYLRDVYNRIVQAIDATEMCRDLLSGLADLHLSNTSNRLNEIMKVLTVISTIFIPLTFIAGIYGMNFAHMPELQLPWGYGATWGIMLAIAGCMIYYFKKKKWF